MPQYFNYDEYVRQESIARSVHWYWANEVANNSNRFMLDSISTSMNVWSHVVMVSRCTGELEGLVANMGEANMVDGEEREQIRFWF